MKSILTRLILAGSAAAITTPALAALPPRYQRVAEMKAILDDGTVMTALKDRPIDSITYVATDHYAVRAGPCRVDVRISDAFIGQMRPGPRNFRLRVGRATCGTQY